LRDRFAKKTNPMAERPPTSSEVASGPPPEEFELDSADDAWMHHIRQAEAVVALGRLGEYELLEEIGRGGQGVVYRARQPGTNREIAIKRLAAGSFATPVMRRRFEREIQLASGLNHPNIVTVHGREIVDGQPLLAMEWVDGVSVVAWAAEGPRRKGPRPCVEMMLAICDAVQHAHQRGVLHRDLKPSNILVDSLGVPHILDFGLAKIIDPDEEAGRTVTLTEQFVGTPTYASPEHLGGGPASVDIRSDIYSLGVVFYQMLTGALPYDTGSTLSEALRAIEHDDPRRPSTVGPRIDGEVEAIVLKALQKDRQQRYQTVDALAADLRRYLAGDPVEAHAPGAWYQLRKLVRRHRLAFAFLLTVVVLLAGFSVVLGIQAARIRTQRDAAQSAAARAEAINEFLLRMVSSPTPYLEGKDVRVVDLLEQAGGDIDKSFAAQPEVRAELHLTIGEVYRQLGLYDEAQVHIDAGERTATANLGAGHPTIDRVRWARADLLTSQGRWEEAGAMYREIVRILERDRGPADRDTLSARNNLGGVLQRQDKSEEAVALFRDVIRQCDAQGTTFADLALNATNNLGQLQRGEGKLREAVATFRDVLSRQRQSLRADHPDLFTTMNNLGDLLGDLNEMDEAIPLLRSALAGREETLGPEHPETIESVNNLAMALQLGGDLSGAAPLFERALEVNRRVLGADHPNTVAAMNNLARLYKVRGDLDLAEPLYREAVVVAVRVMGKEHPNTLGAMSNLSGLLRTRGRLEEAESIAREVVALGEKVLPPDHWALGAFQIAHGTTLMDMERFAEAEPILIESLRILQGAYGDAHPNTAAARANLHTLYTRWGRPDKAAEFAAAGE